MTQFSRRQFVKMGSVVLAGAAFGSVLSACGGSKSAERATDQVVVAMSASSEPAAGFDPCISWGCGEHVHEPLIQSTLITTNTDLEFVNDLATSYKCSDDGMTWTFNLRKDVKFTDGQPLTAADVAFTINTINASDKSEADLSSIKKAEAVSDYKVKLRMAKPNNALLYTLAVVGIVPEHAYGKDYGSNPIGSGRYKLEQWNQGQQVILTANPDYYGDAPTMKTVVVMFMDEDAAMAACESGDVDIAYTSATKATSVPKGCELLSCKSVDSRGLSLPTVAATGKTREGMDGEDHPVGNDVTCNLALRRAMNYGLDRQAVIDNVLNGYGTVAYSVADGAPWASDDMKVEYDLDKAKKILADDGWVAGDDGVLVKGDVRAAFDLLYASNDSSRQAMCMEFSNQMTALGIDVTPKGGDWDTDLYPHQFDTPVFWGWGSNAPVEMYELLHSKGWGNVSSYFNDKIDRNLDKALEAPTIEDSYQYYKKAQWDPETKTGVAPQGAATWVWIANIDHLYFKQEGLEVAEQKPHPHGHGWSLVNNVDKWTWK